VATKPYDPKKALKCLQRSQQSVFDRAKTAMDAAEKTLATREWRGEDTSYARAALYQLDYWTSRTTRLCDSARRFIPGPMRCSNYLARPSASSPASA